MSRKIIIDTDPGQDDALAILLALGSPELEVLGLTIVAGNVPLEYTQQNALKICELAGRPDIKVFAGASKPIMRPLITAEHVHGRTGLDGPELPEPVMQLQTQHAVDFIIETIMTEEAGTVTLCPIGPLTNIALALNRAPEIAGRIKEIVMMGGGFFAGGNITPAAEFNFYVDPEAAKLVFGSGVPLVMVPLDVTHKVMTSAHHIKPFYEMDNQIGKACVAMLEFYERFDVEKYGSDGGPLHDPNVIAYLLEPELYSGKLCNVEIETASELTSGMSVVDWWGVTDRSQNTYVIADVDAGGFFKLLTQRIATL